MDRAVVGRFVKDGGKLKFVVEENTVLNEYTRQSIARAAFWLFTLVPAGVDSPFGSWIRNGHDRICWINLDKIGSFGGRDMIHIAVTGGTAGGVNASFLEIELFYVVEKFEDIYEEHIDACRLLDAAAGGPQDYVLVSGVGVRTFIPNSSGGDYHYGLRASYLEHQYDDLRTQP